MFSLFKRKDPICGMREEKGKGIRYESNWFCSENCLEKYKIQIKTNSKLAKSQKGEHCH